MSFDITTLRLAIENERIVWRKHALQRLAERHILQRDVLKILCSGEVIQSYADDRPFPSVLVFGWVESRPLHVVASYDEIADITYIVTAYEPSSDTFEADFKTKK